MESHPKPKKHSDFIIKVFLNQVSTQQQLAAIIDAIQMHVQGNGTKYNENIKCRNENNFQTRRGWESKLSEWFKL